MRERTSTILTMVFLTGAIALADWKIGDGPAPGLGTKENLGTNVWTTHHGFNTSGRLLGSQEFEAPPKLLAPILTREVWAREMSTGVWTTGDTSTASGLDLDTLLQNTVFSGGPNDPGEPKFRNLSVTLTYYENTNMSGIVWQYDANREWNKSIDEKKERDEQAYRAFLASSPPDNVIFVRSGEGLIKFDFRAQTTSYELGYRPDGVVVWRKTPEREEKK